jgi:murein DD-endopeptidase MepM/ murein hydrolase activator NlpD
MKDIFSKWKKLYKEHKNFIIGVLFVIMVALFSLLGQSQFFKSSLLEVSHPFNGTIFPIEKSPNYLTWSGNIKTDNYSKIPNKDLIELPDYSLALKNGDTDEIKNAKLTFPVVYMGNYKGDHQENKGSHLAVDIRVPVGTPVRSIANGVVSLVKNLSYGFGHHLCIRHSGVPDPDNQGQKTSLFSCYNHMDKIEVETGDFVLKGEYLGTTGNTGTSTTPHLHFQIDRADAPWHPYWPFTSQEALTASLSFFDAVSAGLGQEKAKKMTVNPLNFISKNYNEKNLENTYVASNDNTPIKKEQDNEEEEKLKLDKFKITANKKEFNTEEKTELIISALDQNGEIFSEYKPSNQLEITSTSDSAEFKKTLRFIKGKSRLEVSNEIAENFEIIIKDEKINNKISLQTTKYLADKNENTNNNEENNKKEDKETEKENLHSSAEKPKYVVFSGDENILTGNTAYIEVELRDKNNNPLNNLKEDLEIEFSGKGELSQKTINSNDLKNGKIKITYQSEEEEKAEIKILEETYTVSVIKEIAKTDSYLIEAEEEPLIKGEKNKIFIKAIDKNKNIVPNYFELGEINFKFRNGEGKISPEKLNREDFKEGIAEFYLTPLSEENIQLQALNGIYNGKSDTFSVSNKTEDKKIFTDLKTDHKNAEAIEYLKENEIIGGYPDGSFQPDKKVTRIEALKMLILGLKKGLTPNKELNFPDTQADTWYAPYIKRALKLGMVKGYPDNTFKPANNVNRAEYYKILISASGEKINPAKNNPYQDVSKDTWFADYVYFAKENQISPDTEKFHPEGEVTRAEVAETLYRLIKYQEKD